MVRLSRVRDVASLQEYGVRVTRMDGFSYYFFGVEGMSALMQGADEDSVSAAPVDALAADIKHGGVPCVVSFTESDYSLFVTNEELSGASVDDSGLHDLVKRAASSFLWEDMKKALSLRNAAGNYLVCVVSKDSRVSSWLSESVSESGLSGLLGDYIQHISVMEAWDWMEGRVGDASPYQDSPYWNDYASQVSITSVERAVDFVKEKMNSGTDWDLNDALWVGTGDGVVVREDLASELGILVDPMEDGYAKLVKMSDLDKYVSFLLKEDGGLIACCQYD